MEYINQDISTVTKGVIAHGCNYVGVMGAGVALILSNRYPKCFTEYAQWLKGFPDRKDALGNCIVVEVDDQLHIANCITQGLAYYDGQLATPDAIKTSLNIAFLVANNLKLPIYLPKIGTGLGRLNWEREVEPIVRELATMFDKVDTYVCVYP